MLINELSGWPEATIKHTVSHCIMICMKLHSSSIKDYCTCSVIHSQYICNESQYVILHYRVAFPQMNYDRSSANQCYFGEFLIIGIHWGSTATMYWHSGSLVRAVLGHRCLWDAWQLKKHKLISHIAIWQNHCLRPRTPGWAQCGCRLNFDMFQVNIDPLKECVWGGGYLDSPEIN